VQHDFGFLMLSEEARLLEGDRLAPCPTKQVSVFRILALASVPVLWGSFTPSMKLLLAIKHPPPALLTNLASHTVGAFVLLLLCAVQRPPCAVGASHPDERRRALCASAELGLYLFFGQLTQLLGLAGTSATSNAILVQASVVIVPLLDGTRPTVHAPASWVPTWAVRLLPSLFALGGVALLATAPSSNDADPGPAADGGLGIALSLCSAAFYALHTLRLSEYGDVHATVQAAGQVVSNAVLDILALPLAGRFAGGNAAAWLSGAHHGALRRLALASAWNGVMIVGVTTWAMSFAQQAFPATTAALAYATVWGHIHSIKRQLRTSHPTHPSPCAAAAAGAAIRRPHRRAPHARAALGGAASRRGTRDFGEPRRCETTITSG